ncbi:INVERT_DEFENSINS domain-containing protein [Trichonephila clavata]|uniref:INVERT_DEFENSINS domain-containing protein n=1 Tax=Trichonephila clavata TaxID=2740835 RepID=A0A8X6JAQ6_TRICU|nr:INVERT_DEFENSINS domain-containing protein [Trichonephila clavata]
MYTIIFTAIERIHKCPKGEDWSICYAHCQYNCTNVDQVIYCPLICTPGCVCRYSDYVRGPDGKCIDPKFCPQDGEKNCPLGEEWSNCHAGCQRNCSNVGEEIFCPRKCTPGCVCHDPGTVRGPDRKCIPPALCPAYSEVQKYDRMKFLV